MTHCDQPKPIGPGEELPLSALEAFLKDSVPELDGPITVKQIPSGAPNLTYLISVGSRQMVLRPPHRHQGGHGS